MDYLAYLLYRAGGAVFGALPLRVNFLIGRLLGLIAYYLAAPYRALVLSNLRIAFGGEKTARELRQIARRHFANLGANLLSSLKVASMSEAQLRAVVTIENPEQVIETALREGEGMVYVLSHIGNWELFAQIFPHLYSCGLGTIYQRLGNPYIDAHVRESRGRIGLKLFERKEGFNGAMQLLRTPGGVGILVDQHAGDAGVWCPFFGRLASTSPLAATLALRTGACLVPIALYTDGLAKWRMIIQTPIHVTTRDPALLTAEINRTLEAQIRRAPADWFWVHNRWKTPRPEFLLARYKRGVCLPEKVTPSELKPFRILIRSSNWLGDAVMTVPAVQAIKAGRPDARVAVLTQRKLADFWEIVPGVDEVIAIENGDNVFGVARKIRGRFDVAVVFPNSVRSAIEVFLGGIPRRVGYAGKWRKRLLNQLVREPAQPRPPEHQVRHYLRMAEGIGAVVTDWEMAWNSRPSRERPVANGTPIKLGLCPGADYGPAKRWLPERFAATARAVQERQPCEWMLFGTARDEALGNEIAAGIRGPCSNLIGKTSLAGLISALSQCELLLTNDTGTMHLAAYLKVPTVSIFGSTEPALTGPLGSGHRILRRHVECSPCFLRECPIDFRCMEEVEVEQAVTAVVAVLEERRLRQ